MFDPVVQVEILQIKRILAIVLVQQPSGVVWYKGTKRRGKVVGRTNLVREFGEFNPSSTAREDA